MINRVVFQLKVGIGIGTKFSTIVKSSAGRTGRIVNIGPVDVDILSAYVITNLAINKFHQLEQHFDDQKTYFLYV